MTVDDLMEVWRSQDAAPLHGVNETLLRLALRHDDAKLRAHGQTAEWITYVTTAVVVAFMAVLFVMMFYNDDDAITVWDFVIPIGGAVPAVLMGVALYMSRKAQILREQHFEESLRDQLGRHITQLDYLATRNVWLGRAMVSAGFGGAIASVLGGSRVTMEPNEPFDGGRVVRMILMGAVFSVIAVRAARRRARQDVLPRKRRLEALLKDLDAS